MGDKQANRLMVTITAAHAVPEESQEYNHTLQAIKRKASGIKRELAIGSLSLSLSPRTEYNYSKLIFVVGKSSWTTGLPPLPGSARSFKW